MLLKNNVWRQFPGLATAGAIFGAYVVLDQLIPSFGGSSHGHGHDDHGAGHGDHGAEAKKVRRAPAPLLPAPAPAPAHACTGASTGQRTNTSARCFAACALSLCSDGGRAGWEAPWSGRCR